VTTPPRLPAARPLPSPMMAPDRRRAALPVSAHRAHRGSALAVRRTSERDRCLQARVRVGRAGRVRDAVARTLASSGQCGSGQRASRGAWSSSTAIAVERSVRTPAPLQTGASRGVSLDVP
jgi:hypothetical protein